MKPFTLVCAVTLFTAGLACAQQGTTALGGEDTGALEQKVRDLEDRLVALEGQMRALKAQAGQAPAATPAATSSETAGQAPPPAESVAAGYQHDRRLCGVCGGECYPAIAVARNARV